MDIPLIIDSPSGLAEPWPITCGVPLPEGRFKDTTGLRLVDGDGKTVPCQIDVTATWLSDRSVRWALVSFQGQPDRSYRLQLAESGPAEQARGTSIRITEQAGAWIINTGGAEFRIDENDALVSRVAVDGHVLLARGGRGAYVIDNRGREARLGGPGSDMTSRFCTQGPRWTVVRREGWYVTDEGERLARDAVDKHLQVHGGNHPETGWAWHDLGMALKGQKRYAEAEVCYRKTIDIFHTQLPEGHRFFTPPYRHLADVVLAQGDRDETVKLAAYINPRTAAEYTGRAVLYEQLGEHDKALPDFEKAK